MREGILAETVAEIRNVLGEELGRVRIERVVVGLYFTGALLDTGTAGACATPPKGAVEPACCPGSDGAMAFAEPLRGRSAEMLLAEAASPHPVRRAVGVAVLNALAEACWRRRPSPEVELRAGVDAFQAAGIAPGEHVALVGAFIPFLRALKSLSQPYTVLELDPSMLKPEELPHYRPAAEAGAVIPHADVVLLTGSTLLSDTLESLLALARPEARVVVVGPTVGLRPEAFLRRGVDVVGGVRITDPDAFLDVLAEAGAGMRFFGKSAERVILLRRAPKQGIARAA